MAFFHEYSSIQNSKSRESSTVDRYSLFVKFCESGLGRLHLPCLEDIDYSAVWRESESYAVSNLLMILLFLLLVIEVLFGALLFVLYT